MTRVALQAAMWIGVYLALTLAPLGLLLIPPVPAGGRGFWLEFSVGLGFVGFAMMVVQFALTARFKPLGAPFGVDTILQFHRQTGIIAVCLVLAHPVIAILAEPRHIEFFDPRVNAPRTIALSLVTIALILLIVLPLRRKFFGISYEWWRLTHGVLAILVVTIGLGHMMMVGHYLAPLWKQGLWVLVTGAAFYLLLHVRLLKPMVMKKLPYRVIDVREERGDCWTLALAPEGHGGMRFKAGQYVWLTLRDTPYTLQQHPFSFSSSEERPDRIELTIKSFGDFTSTIRDVKPGARAFLEGPYGGFFLEAREPGAVLIAGGIGITPMMSILRTARGRADERKFILIYGSAEWKKITFREELEELSRQIDLTVIHIIDRAPDDWEGERGFITIDVLRRHVDERLRRGTQGFPFFICGPEPMMNVVETALLELEVPVHHLRSERFNIV